jgi:hypothetical protein
VVANLDQVPSVIPVMGFLLPTLLKQCCVWSFQKQRPLLAKDITCLGSLFTFVSQTTQCVQEHLNCMLNPQWDWLCKHQPWPTFTHVPISGGYKRLAGNAMHAACVGSIWAVVLTNLQRADQISPPLPSSKGAMDDDDDLD